MHCDNEYESQALTVEAALAEILAQTVPISTTETISLTDSLNRVIAEDCLSAINVPPHRNSAMDGYALSAQSLIQPGTSFNIIGDSLAGHPYQGRQLAANECIRIMTGAVLPEDTNSVVMLENVEEQDGIAQVTSASKSEQHIRQVGEDIGQGQLVIKRGKRITPADMGLLHACGLREITVYRIPKVTFFTTGDELKQPGEQLTPGDIYDSNRLSLTGLLQQTYCQINDIGIVRDRHEALEDAFSKAQDDSDCVISTGGVSVGAADHIKQLLKQHGNTAFWRIAMKPGRPLTFGHLHNQALFFGLPGNPVSVMATFYLFVVPALRKLSGESEVHPLRLTATCQQAIRKNPGRTDYQRGILHFDHTTQDLVVELAGRQQSHILSGMSQANCFIELPRESGDLPANSSLTVIPFAGFI